MSTTDNAAYPKHPESGENSLEQKQQIQQKKQGAYLMIFDDN